MRNKIAIVALAATLIGGAAVAVAQESETPDTTETPVAEPGWGRHHRGAIAARVLEDLVTEGVITQDQADSITSAFQERRDEFAAARELMHSFWEDGVLTAEEIAQLPEMTRFTDPDAPFAEALADGQLTREEVEAIREARKTHRQELRDAVKEFMEDGVLSAEEISQLPEPNPFIDPQGALAEALTDGQLTEDELEALRPGRGHHGRHGDGWGGPQAEDAALGA